MRRRLSAFGVGFREAYLWLEDKPVVIIIAAAGTTVGVVLVLASSAGWARVMRLSEANHAWAWLQGQGELHSDR